MDLNFCLLESDWAKLLSSDELEYGKEKDGSVAEKLVKYLLP